MEWSLLLFAVFWLAWANGANDNFKGVATLYGCKAMDYRSALWLATASTFAGSLLSIVLAGALVKTFSGKGLVPDELVNSRELLIAVGGAAAALNGAGHGVLAHVRRFRRLDGDAQAGIHRRIGHAGARRDGYLTDDFGEYLGPLGVLGALAVHDILEF